MLKLLTKSEWGENTREDAEMEVVLYSRSTMSSALPKDHRTLGERHKDGKPYLCDNQESLRKVSD